MTRTEIEALLELANAATPGPWGVNDRLKDDPGHKNGGYEIYQEPGNYGQAITGWGKVTQKKFDAQFIAAARAAVPALAAQCLELMAEVERLRLFLLEVHGSFSRPLWRG